MAKCAVCGRPATRRVTVNEDGKLERVALCDEHYAVGCESDEISGEVGVISSEWCHHVDCAVGRAAADERTAASLR